MSRNHDEQRVCRGPPASGQFVNQWYLENGRWYGSWGRKYMFPCDEPELNRLDIFHKFFLDARNGLLHDAVLGENKRPRILDLGTGTGIWAIQMADRYLDAKVVGIDLTMMQPQWIPRNLAFHRADMESSWSGMMVGPWDLVHLRMLNGSIASWPNLYDRIFSHLQPGCGSIEHVEVDWLPRCDEGTPLREASLRTWAEELLSAMDEAGRPMKVDPHATKNDLRNAGFVDIKEKVIKAPYGAWPIDPLEKRIGDWFSFGLVEGLEALTLAPFTRIKRRPLDEVYSLVRKVQEEVHSGQHKAHCLLYVWTARRSERP